MKHYSTVLFDVDDTLIDFTKSEQASLKKCYEEFFKGVISEEAFLSDYHRINQALWRQVEQGTIFATEVGTLRFKQLAELHRLSISAEVPHFYEQQLIANSEFIEGAEELLDHLISRNVKIGLISNGFAHIQHGKYKDLQLSRYTDVLVISEEVGYSKPHPHIFHYTLERLQSGIPETLMVGDSLSSDGEGARRLQMSFCWYNPKKHPNPADWEPNYVLHDLKDFITLGNQ